MSTFAYACTLEQGHLDQVGAYTAPAGYDYGLTISAKLLKAKLINVGECPLKIDVTNYETQNTVRFHEIMTARTKNHVYLEGTTDDFKHIQLRIDLHDK